MKPQRLIPLKYFIPAHSPYRPLNLNCPVCEHNSSFSEHMRLNTSNGCVYLWTYQCQDCGKKRNSDEVQENGITVALQEPCDCGGQFRRDRNIFCPSCHYRKSEENCRSEKVSATKEEMEQINQRNGTEEMILPFEKSEEFEWVVDSAN